MATRTVAVTDPAGLHARPAAMFVQAASKFDFPVTIGTASAEAVDASSILAVLTLGVQQGDSVTLSATGNDAEEALDLLADLLASSEAGASGWQPPFDPSK